MNIKCWIKKWNPNNNEKPHHYRFDWMEDNIKNWKTDHITRQMISMMPFDIFIFGELTPNGYQKDHYWEDIKDLADFQQWHKEREEYIDYLYEKYKR